MKKYGIRDLSSKVGTTIANTNKLLAELGIIGSPEQQYLTEKGKQYAEDKWIENDRYGRSYWYRVYNSELVDMLKKLKNQ